MFQTLKTAQKKLLQHIAYRLGKRETIHVATQTYDPDELFRSSLECLVCMEILLDPVTLGCGHSFCLHCIAQNFYHREQVDLVCPCCRHEQREPVNVTFALRRVIQCSFPTLECNRRNYLTSKDLQAIDEFKSCWNAMKSGRTLEGYLVKAFGAAVDGLLLRFLGIPLVMWVFTVVAFAALFNRTDLFSLV